MARQVPHHLGSLVSYRIPQAPGLALALYIRAVQEGILEDLLASPAIQSLLVRVPALQATMQRCAKAKYQQRNTAACVRAENTARLAKVPLEMRALLSVPASDAALRDLYLAD